MGCDTNCEAEKAAMRKAIAALLVYRKEITALLQRERPAEVYDLLHPIKKKLGAYQNLSITYFDFPTYLWRFNAKRIYELKVDINSYRYQRATHIQDVAIELVKFRGKDTGKALLDEIEATQHELNIYPFWNFKLYSVLPFRPVGLNATAHGGLERLGIKGSDSIIMFSPHMWGRDGKPGTSGWSGPGSKADEVLFHELIHGVRLMEGVNADKNVVENYKNEEEFIAVVLSNIYLAEKGQQILRGGDRGLPSDAATSRFLEKSAV